MKKNTTTMLLILAVIAVLHFAFLLLFFLDREDKAKNPPTPPALVPQPPEPTVAYPEKKTLLPAPADPSHTRKKKPQPHQLAGPLYLIQSSMS
jgi:type IV secretory pathway VirB10-like protein